jgi:hypothetical protein
VTLPFSWLRMTMGDFSYRRTKDGRVLIAHRGRDVVTLTGSRAARFSERAATAGEAELQLLMARFTGNFKRGNERPAR